MLRAPFQVRECFVQLLKVLRPPDQGCRCLFNHPPMQVRHLLVVRASGQPVKGRVGAPGRECQPDTNRGLCKAPSNWTPDEFAVFSVFPGRLIAGRIFPSAGEIIGDLALSRSTIGEEIAVELVVDHGLGARIKKRRVADLVTIEVKVMAKEKPDVTRSPRGVDDLDLLDIHIQLEINGILTPQR